MPAHPVGPPRISGPATTDPKGPYLLIVSTIVLATSSLCDPKVANHGVGRCLVRTLAVHIAIGPVTEPLTEQNISAVSRGHLYAQ